MLELFKLHEHYLDLWACASRAQASHNIPCEFSAPLKGGIRQVCDEPTTQVGRSIKILGNFGQEVAKYLSKGFCKPFAMGVGLMYNMVDIL